MLSWINFPKAFHISRFQFYAGGSASAYFNMTGDLIFIFTIQIRVIFNTGNWIFINSPFTQHTWQLGALLFIMLDHRVIIDSFLDLYLAWPTADIIKLVILFALSCYHQAMKQLSATSNYKAVHTDQTNVLAVKTLGNNVCEKV